MKNLIKKNDFLWMLAQIMTFKRRNRACLDSSVVTVCNVVKHKSGSVGKAPFCIIESGSTNGLGASLRAVLDGLYYCDRMGVIPYVRFVDSYYYDKSMPSELNPFEYYFVQPTNYSLEELTHRHPQLMYSTGKASLVWKMNIMHNKHLFYTVSEHYISEMAVIMGRLLHFNTDTQAKIDEALSQLNLDEMTLAVHIRGTDFKKKYRDHPTYVAPIDYYPFIEEAIDKHNFTRIFVATDDEELLQEFIEHFGESSVVYSKKVKRISGDVGIHMLGDISPYEKGLDVIADIASLASCGGIVCGLSQVSTIARIYKKSKSEEYKYERIIDKGLNNSKKLMPNSH